MLKLGPWQSAGYSKHSVTLFWVPSLEPYLHWLSTQKFDMDLHANAPASIYDATELCRSSFQECLDIKELMKDEWAENRLADFNLWAAGVGASARQEACLDTRLSDEPGARQVVIGLLVSLEAYIEQCKSNGKIPSSKSWYMHICPKLTLS